MYKMGNLKEINTDIELNAIAPTAIIKFDLGPPNINSIPAAKS